MLNKSDDDNEIDMYEKELGLLLLKYLKIPLVTTLPRNTKREKDWECIGIHNSEKLKKLCKDALKEKERNSTELINNNEKIVFSSDRLPSYWKNDELCVFHNQYSPIPLYQFLTSFNEDQTKSDLYFFSNDEVREISDIQEHFTHVNLDFKIKYLVDSKKKNKTYSLHLIRRKVYQDSNGRRYNLGDHIIPFDDKIPFYKKYELFSQNRIILTDNLVIVNSFSHAANNNGFVFCGIYVPRDIIDPSKYDWSELERHDIYYLLLEHSGYSTFSTYERASRILEHIKSNRLNIRLRFIRFPYDTKKLTGGNPEFLNIEEFENAFACLTPPNSYMEMLASSSISPPPRFKKQNVVTPYFKTGECHFLYGGINDDLIRLCAMLGLCIAMGDTFVPSIKAQESIETLYINRRMSGEDFAKILEEALCSRWIDNEREKMLMNFSIGKDIPKYPDIVSRVYFLPNDLVENCPKYNEPFSVPALLQGKGTLKYTITQIVRNEAYEAWFLILKAILELIHKIDPKVIILDLPDIQNINNPTHSQYLHCLYDFLQSLKSKGCCVIVVGPEILSKQSKIYQLPFDKIYRFENIKPKIPSEITLRMNLEYGDLPKTESNRLFTFSKVKGWFLEDRKLLKEEIEILFKKNKKLSIKEMMGALNLSESQVKALRKKCGIAKSIPQRKPRFPTNRKGKSILFTG